MASLKKNMLWNSIGSITYLGCNWLTTVFVVTMSGYDASGSLAIAMAVGNVFATIMLFRVRMVQISDLENEFSTSDYVGFRLITFALAVVFCAIYTVVSVAPDDFLVVVVYLLFRAGESYIDVLHGVDQRKDRFDYIGISQLLRGILLIAAFVVGLLAFKSIVIAVLLMGVTTFAVLALYDYPRTRKLSPLAPSFHAKKVRRLFLVCLPGLIGLLLCTLAISLVRQVYGLEYGNEMLGIYAAVAAPTVIIQALASYIYVPLMTPTAEAWFEGTTGRIVKFIGTFAGAFIAVLVVAVMAFELFGPPMLVAIYGESIAGYMYLITPLLICTGMTAIVYYFQDLLIVFRCFAGVIASSTAAFIVSVASMSAFFDVAGMNGISFAIIAGYGANIVIAGVFIAYKLLKRKQEVREAKAEAEGI